MNYELEEFFATMPFGITLESSPAGDIDSPFEPHVAFYATNEEGAQKLISHMGIPAARELAYKILADCEAALAHQERDLRDEMLVKRGLLPESERPTARYRRELEIDDEDEGIA